ncbi:retrovirus-related pol polyprotein from transposon TNT 1-94 [Tanacetum coccineum]
MHECNSDPLALVASHQMTQSPYQSHQHSYQNSQHQQFVSPYPSPQYGSPYQSQQCSTHQSSTPLLITYPSNEYQQSIHHNVYSPSSSIPQLEYAPLVNQQSKFSEPDSGLIALVFQKGDDPIDAINHKMSFLTTVVLQELSLKEQVGITQGNRGLLHVTTTKGKDTCLNNALNQGGNGMIHGLKTKVFASSAVGTQSNVGDIIEKTNPIENPKSEETSMLAEESHFETRFVLQTELFAEQAFWSQNSVNSLKPILSSRPTIVEVPKELPKGHRDNSVSNQSAPSFDQLFELNELKCNGCMLSDNHDLCVLDFINNVNARKESKSINKSSKRKVWKPTGKVFSNIGYIWRPTGRTFTIVGNACPLTRITTTTEVPLRKSTALDNETSKPVVTLVYSRKPRKSKTNVPVSKSTVLKSVVQIVLWYLDSGCSKHMTGDRSQLTNFVNKFLGTVKFGNDHVAKILGYGDYQIGNVTISRVYYVEGLGHNLFSVGQFCDSNLEVAFHMMASSPICLLSKASKTKSWLWHRRLSHLNFGAINQLARHGLVRGLPKLKFEKDHLCSACAMGKSKKKPHKPKSEDTNQEKLYLLHMDLCGPMRVASVNGKKYILVIVDDYSRFTWVKFLRSKDEAPDFIIKFLKMIQLRLQVTVRRIRTDNGTEFVNQTLREYYEKIGISHETSVAHSP